MPSDLPANPEGEEHVSPAQFALREVALEIQA
jgi:hypothetical protein